MSDPAVSLPHGPARTPCTLPALSPEPDPNEVAIRKLLPGVSGAAHRALDDELEALLHDVESGVSTNHLQTTSKRLIDELQGDPNRPTAPRLVMRGSAGWEARWMQHRDPELQMGLFVDGEITSSPVVHALVDVVFAMAMLVMESNRSSKKHDNKTALVKDLRDYLELRGRGASLVAPHQRPGRGTGKGKKPARNPGKPGRDRQDDILATIRAAGTPLTRPEIMEAMRLKTEGKLGANLAWMVTNDILISVPQRGYWPAQEVVPE